MFNSKQVHWQKKLEYIKVILWFILFTFGVGFLNYLLDYPN